jgi:hypothetical protein
MKKNCMLYKDPNIELNRKEVSIIADIEGCLQKSGGLSIGGNDTYVVYGGKMANSAAEAHGQWIHPNAWHGKADHNILFLTKKRVNPELMQYPPKQFSINKINYRKKPFCEPRSHKNPLLSEVPKLICYKNVCPSLKSRITFKDAIYGDTTLLSLRLMIKYATLNGAVINMGFSPKSRRPDVAEMAAGGNNPPGNETRSKGFRRNIYEPKGSFSQKSIPPFRKYGGCRGDNG